MRLQTSMRRAATGHSRSVPKEEKGAAPRLLELLKGKTAAGGRTIGSWQIFSW